MRWWAALGYSVSIAAHFGLAAGIGSIPKNRPRKPTTIQAFEAKKKEAKKAEEPEKKPPKPPPKKAEPPPEPKNTPPPPTNNAPTPAGHEAMAALPDFGIALSGGGEGGIAVPVGGMASNAGAQRGSEKSAAPSEKKVRGPAPKPTDTSDSCVDEPTKPKYRERVQPQYPDSARAANVEGKIRIEVTINAEGDVVDAKIVQGLGHGLDEAALVAMKRTKFQPATKCGKPVATTIIIPVNFSLSD